ncbi:MAG: hypothetical protein RH917_19320 [Lacipirellulaceae bacterium]
MLTQTQQEEACRVVVLGCDRETACQYVDCTQAELREALWANEQFCKRMKKAEATAEVNYMKTIHNAAKDEKNWRASVWWFERRSPERFARRAATVTPHELNEVIDLLETLIAEEINDVVERRRLLARLESINRVAKKPRQTVVNNSSELYGEENDWGVAQ